MTGAESLAQVPPPPWMPGIIYGLALLASGWIFGPLRALLVMPLVGPLAAVWLEAPLMIAVMISTVRWMQGLGWIGRDWKHRMASGLIGACLVLLGEGAGALLMRDSREALNTFVTPAGLVGLALVAVAALVPLILLAWPAPDQRLR